MKYKLEFEDIEGNIHFIGAFSNWELANQALYEDLHSKGIKPYYYRHWSHMGRTTIDFGSHSEFYYITQISEEEYVNLTKKILKTEKRMVKRNRNK